MVREAASVGGFRVIVLATASAKEIDEAVTTLAQAHAAALLIAAPQRLGDTGIELRYRALKLPAHLYERSS
jgi:hypothetical protein